MGGALLSGMLLLSQLLVFAAGPAAACDRSLNAEVLAHLGGSGLGKVVVSGTHAYAAATGGLVVFDVSNAAAPEVLAQVPLPGTAADLALDGSFVYVVGDWGEMQIVDVTDPAAPVLRGSVGWGDEMRGVAVLGDRAYVTSDGHGLKVVDVSDKDEPGLVTYVAPPTGAQFYDVAISGSKAYVTFGASPTAVNKVRCFNLPTPDAQPVKLGNDYNVPGLGVSVRSILASGALVFAAEAARGLEVVDFTTATVPAQRGTFAFAGAGGFDLAKVGNTLYLASGDGGLKVLNVADPASPALLGTLGGTYAGVAVDAGKAYLTMGGTLTVADVSDSAAPGTLGSVQLTPADARDVFISGSYAYIAAGSEGLLKVSSDATAGLKVLGSATGPIANASKVVVTDDEYAYVADGASLRIFDVSADTPVFVAGMPVNGPIEGMCIDGDRLYLAEGNQGLRVLNIADRDAPVLVGGFKDPALGPLMYVDTGFGAVHAVAADGDRVYIGTDGGRVISLAAANPAAITERARMGTYGDVLSLSLSGGLLYAGTSEKVYKIDAGDPTELFQIGDYYYFGENVVAVKGAGNYAYAATDAGFFLIDFSDAAEPYIAMDFGEWAIPMGGLDVVNDVVFLAARGAGFYAVRVPVLRTSGNTRYDTAVEMSKANWDGAANVVLATGANYADAACSAPLAHALGGPLLLVHPTGIPASVLAEIQRLAAGAGGISNMNVVIVGSTNAVPGTVEGALTGLGVPPGNIKRLAGWNRYDTARMIAHEFKLAIAPSVVATAFIATGDNFPDALTVSGVGAAMEAPVLLVRASYVPTPTLAALADLGDPALIAVGSNKVISDALYDQLGCVGRLGGDTRYDTAKLVAEYALQNGFADEELIVTTGANFPDALVAGVVSAKRASPIMLVSTGLPSPTASYINEHPGLKSITVVGSAKAVSEEVENQIVDELVW